MDQLDYQEKMLSTVNAQHVTKELTTMEHGVASTREFIKRQDILISDFQFLISPIIIKVVSRFLFF